MPAISTAAGFGAGSSVCPTDQITILNAIVAKLRVDISDLFGSETTCFLSATPWPAVEVNDDVFCTVNSGNSSFEYDEETGQGSFGVLEHGVFQVTVWSKLSTDRLDHDVYAMTDATRGVLKIKQLVLKCLAGQQLYNAETSAPLLSSGCLRPTSTAYPPPRHDEADYTSFSLAFSGSFYWDLVS